jgi:hypothetical protein
MTPTARVPPDYARRGGLGSNRIDLNWASTQDMSHGDALSRKILGA